jgi:hypothetical protein
MLLSGMGNAGFVGYGDEPAALIGTAALDFVNHKHLAQGRIYILPVVLIKFASDFDVDGWQV